MQYVEANGARIPALGLGTWDLHGAAEIVEQTLRLGYRYIDTAEMYGTETEVGEGLRASGVARDEVFITTKVWPDHLAPAALERAAKASLARGLAGGAGVGLRGSVERRRPAAGPETHTGAAPRVRRLRCRTCRDAHGGGTPPLQRHVAA
jgi:hypothetical protein